MIMISQSKIQNRPPCGGKQSKIPLVVRRTIRTVKDIAAMDREARLLTGTGLDFKKLTQNEKGQFEMRFVGAGFALPSPVGATLASPSGKDLLK